VDSLSGDLTKSDFMQSGWEGVITECEEKECYAYSSRFATKAREAEESGDSKAHQVFVLLSSLTSMHFKLDSPEEPFGPMMVFHDRRTATVDDFDESHLALLSEIATDISDPELRARISDVLWLRKRDFRVAELAISAYLESAKSLEHPEQWTATADRIERALQLATMLGKNSERFSTVTNHIEGVLAKYDGEDPLFLSAKLMKLLQERSAGDAALNAARAEKLALRAESSRDWRRAKEYWGIKAKWHLMGKDEEQARKAKLLAAETHVKQAEEHLHGDTSSYMLASSHMQFAIEAFRRIPNTKERVSELQKRLLEYQEKSTAELIPFSSSVDVSDIVKLAIDHVKGKPLPDALMSLATLDNPPKVAALRAQAKEYKEKYLAQSFFPRVYLNAMGRVIARQPRDSEESLLADMYSNASMSRLTHVQALVEPARHQINLEHDVRVDDLLPFIYNNPFVPAGHEYIIARGVHAGMHGDFLTAVHFLIPQIEASIRYVLAQVGVITSGFDDDGIQDEYNLNRTLRESAYTDALTKVFGEDFLFDMRGLLIERFGANLRNDMAHGLIDHNAFYSESGCYLWWLTLRLYSLPTVAKLRRDEASADEVSS